MEQILIYETEGKIKTTAAERQPDRPAPAGL